MSRPTEAEPLATPGRSTLLSLGIYSTPGVCGGDACVGGTRITVRSLEQLRRLGARVEDLLESYPSLGCEDVLNAWAYARAHREEIDRQIHENEREDD